MDTALVFVYLSEAINKEVHIFISETVTSENKVSSSD
jgi:hypothetical protein